MASLHGINLRIGYGRHTVVEVEEISFDTPAIVSIVGANGCGKSTLVKGLSRLLPLQSGRVELDGEVLSGNNTRQTAQKMAVLAQSATAPLGMKVIDLVACGRNPHRGYFTEFGEMDREIVERVMEETKITPYRDRLMGALSGGERQRVWLAMALAQEPEILILDEPTTYLDVHHQLQLMELIERSFMRRSMTIIMVLHDLNQALRYSHRVIAMKAGRIVGDGLPHEVLTAAHIADWFGVRMKAVTVEEGGQSIHSFVPLRVTDPLEAISLTAENK